MENWSEKKKLNWLILCGINFFVIMLTCRLMLNIHFSPDTYDIWTTSDNNVDVHLRDGRFITAALYQLLAILGANVAKCQSIFTVIFIITISFVVTTLTYAAKQYLKDNDYGKIIGVDAAFLLIFHNAFIAEWYLFPESLLMYSVCMLGMAGAVLLYIRTIECKSIRDIAINICGCFVLLIIALGTYQVSIGMYISLLFIFIFINDKLEVNKKIVYAGIGLFIGTINCVLNIVIVKLLTVLHVMQPTPRGAALNITAILNNIKSIIASQGKILCGHNLFKPYTLIAYFGILLIVTCITTYRQKVEWKKIVIAIVFTLCIYIGSYIPHFVSSDFWLSQRTLVPMFGVYSFLIIAIVSIEKKKSIQYFVTMVAVIFVLDNSVLMNDIFSNHLSMDNFDVAYAKEINHYIEKYTEETGLEVNFLSIARDENPTWSYEGIKYVTYDINVKNILRSWSNIGLINTANNTNYSAKEMDDKIWQEYFEGKDWNQFEPEEQIVFDGDTAYIVIY